MPLINCEECGREISDKSSACVHCGNPIKNENKSFAKSEESVDSTEGNDAKQGWLGCIGIIILLVLLVQCGLGESEDEQFDPNNPEHLEIIFDE